VKKEIMNYRDYPTIHGLDYQTVTVCPLPLPTAYCLLLTAY